MPQFAIIEVDDGLAVAEFEPGLLPEEVAAKHGGTLIDPGPYKSYEDAYDAMVAIQAEEEDEDLAP
jgi:hypothetical protein